MKIAILTQMPDAYETKRLHESALLLGYSCDIIKITDITTIFGSNYTNIPSDILYKGRSISDYDIVINRYIFSYNKLMLGIIDYLRSKKILVYDNNLNKVGSNMNKIKDGISFSTNNLKHPKTISTLSESSFKDYCQLLGFPVIVKNINTGQGKSIYKLESDEQVLEFIENLKATDGKLRNYLIQEYIPYDKDIRVLVIDNKYIGAMHRIPAEGEFRANFSQGGSVEIIQIQESFIELALKAALTTQAYDAGVDLLMTKDNEAYVLEVNRTPGFEGFELAINLDIGTLLIKSYIKNSY